MHRIYRNDMPQAQKDKIAAAQTGRKLSQDTKEKISHSMQMYWQGLPMKPGTDNPNSPDSTRNQPKQPPLPSSPFED